MTITNLSKRSGVIGTTVLALTLALSTTMWSNFATAALDKGVLTLAMAGEPPNLDSTKATDAESFFILGHTMEGLTRYDKNGKIVAGVAEKWEITDTGATFYLRKNAKWSDGKPVTAKDFVYALKTVVDPKTASEYAFITYPIKNAEAINTKKAAPGTELGVVATDDHTIKFTFEKPCGYFLSLTTFATYYPVREDVRAQFGDKYAAEAGNLMYNGAFKLTKWVHGAALKMEKNDQYWNAAAVKLAAIDIPYITPDDTARFNLFKDKKIDNLGLSKDTLVNAQKEKFKVKKYSDGTLFYLSFNFREGRITANKNLRKAIAAMYNPTEYVSRVVGIPGTQPGVRLVPNWMMGTNKLFKDEYPVPTPKQNIVAAKKHLADALKELKMDKLPPLVWLTGDSPLASRESEYFQGLFKTHLGIELRIDKQIFKQRLAKMTAGDFDIVAAGWGPDYADPMTFADLFSSWNDNNRGLWKNAKYDEHIRAAQATSDQKVRMDNMAKAEKILLEELPIVPTYERTVMYTHSDRLDGIVRRSVGFDPDYTHAVIKK